MVRVPAGDDHTSIAVLTEQVRTLMAEVRTLTQTTVPREVCAEKEKARDAASNGKDQLFTKILGAGGFLIAVASLLIQFR